MSTILTAIDARHSRLLEHGAQAARAVSDALDRADAEALHRALASVYGDLLEVILLGHGRAVLVWSGGLGTLAGAESDLPTLTYGHYGAGPKLFTAFLRRAGFADCDAVALQGPLLLRRDGGRETGTLDGKVLRWDDWTRTLIPPFPKARAPRLANGVGFSCQACGRAVRVEVQARGVALVGADRGAGDLDQTALRCRDCGFVCCWTCARGETASVCPACRSQGGPRFFTE